MIDIVANSTIADGLSMPHSPRWHANRLWLLNSGTGYLGFIDERSGRFEPVTFLPGYGRGFACHGHWAIIGLSKPRREQAFQGLPLDTAFQQRGEAPLCGLAIVDLTTGTLAHLLRVETQIEELYDVAVLPQVRQPRAQSLTRESLGERFCFEHCGQVYHWSESTVPITQAGK